MSAKNQNALSTTPPNLSQRLAAKLASASKVLVFGVGGGNDSVSTLLAQRQLAQDFAFRPSHISIVAMLPDVLDYHGMESTEHPLVWRVRADSRRSVQGTPIRGFPEPILAKHKERFGIEEVLGISMREGSIGVSQSLRHLIHTGGFDLILACDIGGDFIAAPENHDVLSPMMDAYALDALRTLITESTSIVCCVFGLGTDGESSPEMLRKALIQVGEFYTGKFDPTLAVDVEHFYRETVEPSRYSRTADFTLRQILHPSPHPSTVRYRARFHSKPTKEKSACYYGYFDHTFDSEHFGRYYLFDDLSGVCNPFAIRCANGIEWFIKIQRIAQRINHELLGQAYVDIGPMLDLDADPSPCSLYFGTPSRQFAVGDRRKIVADTLSSLRNGVYDLALVYGEDLQGHELKGFQIQSIGPALVVLGQTPDASLVRRLTELER